MPGYFESINSLDFLRGFADGDQVNGEQDRIKETSDLVTDMAENRIEGMTQDEARSLGETLRDFFSSKDSIDEFRKKNATKIEADKKLIGNILNSTPAGKVKNFIVKSVIKNYGPQFMDMTENFFKNILPLEDKSVPAPIQWSDYLDNQAYSKGAFNAEDYLSKGQGSNLRAYLEMLPGDQEIKAKDLLGELRRLGSEKYSETPFGKFYNPAELKESGMEYQLLKFIDQDPNGVMTKDEYLKMFNVADPKTKYQGFENKISTKDTLLQNYRVGIENITNATGGTKEFKDMKFNVGQAMEDQFLNLDQKLRGVPEGEQAAVIKDMIVQVGKPYYDQIKKNFKQISRLENSNFPFPGKKQKIAYLHTVNNELNRLLNMVTTMADNVGFDTPVQQNLSSGQSGITISGGQNYTVKGITFEPRDIAGWSEGVSSGTHFNSQFGRTDAFHIRSADYKDLSGQDVTIIQEIQSDQEEPRRKSFKVQDPVADLKYDKLEKGMQEYVAKNVLPEMEKRGIDQAWLEAIESLFESETQNFVEQQKRKTGEQINFPNFDKVVKDYLDTQWNAPESEREQLYRFYKKIKPLYSQYKIPMWDISRKSGGDYSALVPFVSNPQLYAKQGIWQTALDSIQKGVNFVGWLPGEVETQIQHGGYNSNDYTDPLKIIEAHGKQARGHFNFYGSALNTESNTMYKAAQDVIQKFDNIASILGWENYKSPVLYAQGNQYLNLAPSQFGRDDQLSRNQTKGKTPGIKEGYPFIDFTPMVESLTKAQKEQLYSLRDKGLLPKYNSGGQVKGNRWQ